MGFYSRQHAQCTFGDSEDVDVSGNMYLLYLKQPSQKYLKINGNKVSSQASSCCIGERESGREIMHKHAVFILWFTVAEQCLQVFLQDTEGAGSEQERACHSVPSPLFYACTIQFQYRLPHWITDHTYIYSLQVCLGWIYIYSNCMHMAHP